MERNDLAADCLGQQFQQDQNHHQQKDFQCPICLKFFSRKFTLEMHLLIHQGVKPHACPFCGKCFRQKGTLMRHKALHSNTTLFHCSLCNRGFRQKNVFLHHLKHRHEVSTEKLDRRKCRTQLADSQSLMNTLPPFAVADTTAITSSDKHLEAMLFQSFGPNAGSQDGCSQSLVYHVGDTAGTQSQDSSDSSRGYTEYNKSVFHEDATDKSMLPDSSSSTFRKAQCKWESSGIQINSHVFDSERTFRYECGLCLKLFMSQLDYSQHIAEEHGNIDMMIDRKPIITPATDGARNRTSDVNGTSSALDTVSRYEPINTSPSCKGTELSTSTTGTARINSRSHQLNTSNTSSTSGTSKSSEITFTCIPCNQDFTTEEDFECHVKTHVQSVLLSDSDSLENDGSQGQSQFFPAQHKDKISSGDEYNNQSLNNNQGTWHHIDVNKASYSSNVCQSTSQTRSVSSRASSLLSVHNETKCSDSTIIPKSELTSANYIESGINAKTLFKVKPKSDSLARKDMGWSRSKSVFVGSSPEHCENLGSKRRIVQNMPTPDSQGSGTSGLRMVFTRKKSVSKQNPQFVQVFLCPFCKKLCTSAKALCQHTERHVRSVIPKGGIFSRKLKSKNIQASGRVLKKHERLKRKKLACLLSTKANKLHDKGKCKMQTTAQSQKCNNKALFHSYNVDNVKKEEIPAPEENSAIHNQKISLYINTALVKETGNDLMPRPISHSSTSIHTKDTVCKNSPNSSSLRKLNPYGLSLIRNTPLPNHFTCIKCSKVFKNKVIYHYHMQMHLSVRVFTCFSCKKSFRRKDLLLYHTRSTHLRSYKCALCSRTFQYQVLFKYHMQKCSRRSGNNAIFQSQEHLKIPLINLQMLSQGNTEGIVGIIPVGSCFSNGEKNSPLIGIPVVSVSHMNTGMNMQTLPILGSVSLGGKIESLK